MAFQKASQESGPLAVRHFLDKLEHPLKQEIEVVRALILAAKPELNEHIKWNAPSFCLQQEDRITFNLKSRDSIRLIFHRGAKAKAPLGKGYLIEDASGLLDWAAPDRAIATFTGMADVEAKKAALADVVKAWLAKAGEES
ncbi:DUF1801 domain-containing protein [Cesiribacter andamanensis]|uniref:YdhG-like domain-containing protein n=1 Tax=Cesiribacter andamanensis AMV16 TaxID=1279009 RepID=M7N315_9BACT|nr:DUF1801 domain-containing protein [Cesiribacter andamanensis]EMR03078.1 hypothetical protein ADICEAN_01807 [Cesiribacter andamanensis AMV16]